MLRLIEALLPRFLHRWGLRLAHRLRHRWRLLRRVPLAGVSILAEDKAGNLMLVRHSYGPPDWALPGGGMKPGEDPVEAAKRELSEEVGCQAQTGKVLFTLDEVISGSAHRAYIVHLAIDQQPIADHREIARAQMFALDDLPEGIGPLARKRIAAWRAHRLQQR